MATNTKNQENKQPAVLNIIRYIAKGMILGDEPPAGMGAWTVKMVNELLDEYYRLGYRIVNTHYLGENPEGFGMLYVLHLIND